MRRLISRLSHSLRGLSYAIRKDSSFQSQFFGGILFLGMTWLIFSPLAAWEWLFVILCWILILITELQNSALEEALNKIHPELHINIGRSKDMAAGAVLLAAVYTLATIVALTLVRLLA